MEKKWYSAETIGDSVITLGKAGEGEAVRIEIDASEWLAKYPNAQLKLYVQPAKPGMPYFAQLDVTDSLVGWTLRKSDTQHVGGGVIELMLLDGDDVLIKSRTARTQLLPSPSTGGASEDPPGVNPAWWEEPIKKINEAAATVIGNANQAINQHAAAVKQSLPQDYTYTYDRAIRNERTKAPVIECEATGPVVTVDDAAAMPVMRLVSNIKAYQNTSSPPTPDSVKRIHGYTFASAYRTGKNILGGLAFAELIASKVPGAVLDTEAKTISYTYNQIGGTMLSGAFKPDTTYTIVLTCVAQKTGASSNIAVYYSDGTYARIDFPNSSTAEKESKVFVTSGKSITSLSGFLYGGTTTLLYEECGIFEGVIDESQFEPYQGQQAKVEFQEAVYGGKMDWQTGVLTVDCKYYEFTGSEINGTINAGNDKQYFYRNIGKTDAHKSGVGICSHFENNSKLISNTEFGFTIVNSSTYDRIVFRPNISTVTDVESFKTYLEAQYNAGKPVQVVAKLNEPYTVQLTPQQLDMLKGYNNVWSNCGDTDITYPADTKIYIDKKFDALAAALIGG